jgi:hypothetical protein
LSRVPYHNWFLVSFTLTMCRSGARPSKVRVLTLGEEEPLLNYAKAIVNEFRANFVRVSADFGPAPSRQRLPKLRRRKSTPSW